MKKLIKVNVNRDTTTKKLKFSELSLSITTVFFEHTNFKDDLINVYVGCNKNYQQKFDEKLKKRFLNAYKFYFIVGKMCLSLWIYG